MPLMCTINALPAEGKGREAEGKGSLRLLLIMMIK